MQWAYGEADAFRPRLIREADHPLTIARADGRRWWRDRRRRRMLGLADLIVALGVSLAVVAITDAPTWWALVTAPIGPLAAKLFGLYDIDHRTIRHLTVDELSRLAGWMGASIALVAVITPGTVTVTDFVLLVLAATAFAFSLRVAARAIWRAITPRERTLVVGEGSLAFGISRKIELFDEMHLELDRTEPPGLLEGNGGEGDEALADSLRGIDRVVLAWQNADPRFIERLLTQCRRVEVKLSVVSPFRGLARPAEKVSHVADLPVLEYNTWDVPRSTMLLKRGLDVVFSTAALAALSPLFALTAILIKADSRGPVLYRQERAGRRGRPFRMIKFRSMTNDAEEHLADLITVDELESPVFKIRADPRVTRVGRYLRRLSIDELPQLINVLRGEMSLVGPRPEELMLVSRYETEHLFRLEVRPGLTGPMQVLGRGELNFAERLAVDMDYLETLSVTRDLRLIALTIPTVIRGKGAF